jgi:hypothetical protein
LNCMFLKILWNTWNTVSQPSRLESFIKNYVVDFRLQSVPDQPYQWNYNTHIFCS